MSPTLKFPLISLVALTSAGCTMRPVRTSTEPSIWVIKGNNDVYRCTDVAEEGGQPAPVCVEATQEYVR